MKHYSASQINMFMRCSAQWKFRYIDGLIEPPSSALVQGKSFHKAVETNFNQKIESQTDLTTDHVLEAYSCAFDEGMREVEKVSKTEIGELKDEGVRIVSHYHETRAPQIKPEEVEKEISIEFDNVDYKIIGYIDLIANGGKVFENKTTGKTPTEVSADHILQGSIYAISTGVDEVTYDYTVKLKTPKVVTIPRKITQDDKAFTLALTGKVDHAAKAGVYLPNRNSFMCSRRQCGYWQHCEKEFKGRVKD